MFTKLSNGSDLSRAVLVTALATMLLGGSATLALAQSGDDPGSGDQVRQQERLHSGEGDQAQQQDRQRLRERIRDCVESDSALSAGERRQMNQNLEACLRLELPDSQIEDLFPGSTRSGRLTSRGLLQFQNRVVEAAGEGLPVEPILAKFQEGLIKGVPESNLSGAIERMEAHVRSAHRAVNRAMEASVSSQADIEAQQRAKRTIAQQMWRGLDQEGLDQLCERARTRARDGSCNPEDFSSAAELAAQVQEEGAERTRAIRMAGDALQNGYTAQQMRQLRFMVMASNRHGSPLDSVLDDMEDCLGDGMGTQEMARRMVQAGWMGPGQHGPGGQGSIDHVGGGPGNRHGHGGEDNDGHHGPGGGDGSGDGGEGNGPGGDGSGDGGEGNGPGGDGSGDGGQDNGTGGGSGGSNDNGR